MIIIVIKHSWITTQRRVRRTWSIGLFQVPFNLDLYTHTIEICWQYITWCEKWIWRAEQPDNPCVTHYILQHAMVVFLKNVGLAPWVLELINWSNFEGVYFQKYIFYPKLQMAFSYNCSRKRMKITRQMSITISKNNEARMTGSNVLFLKTHTCLTLRWFA